MLEPQQGGMEEQPLAEAAHAIKSIADHRTSQAQWVAGVQPELMCPPGQRHEHHQGTGTLLLYFPPPGDSQFAPDRIIYLIGPVFWIEPEA